MTCDALFNNFCFLFLFLPAVLAGYWIVPHKRWKLAWIAAASLVFYSFWDVRFTLLLLGSVVVDFLIGLRLETAKHRRTWLAASIAFNLGVLAFFKYFVFAVDNARSLFDFLGVPAELPYYSIVLPVGISFYTFQSMSYTIDVYRRDVSATRDPLKYLAFVTLFPQLVAGPIVRYRVLADQLDALPARPVDGAVVRGLSLFAIGLFKKVAIADTIAASTDPLWAEAGGLTTAAAWAAALGFALQLYFDFSGYSDMAMGLGSLLGFEFPVNFRAPYQALNPSDFWRRWHITLSSFLRDYLYVPLGGNRAGRWRVGFNLMITMLLGGLWHGAAWTFVAWGAYQGVLLVLYKHGAGAWDALPHVIQRAGMFLLVVGGWVLFRAPDLATAGQVYAAMFRPTLGLAGLPPPLVLAVMALALAVAFVARPAVERRFRPTPAWAAIVAIMLTGAVILLRSQESPFLYYQF